MTIIMLWILATLDAAFTAYREAAGRNALIRKGSYYRRAMLRGALWGQGAVAIALVVVLISLALVTDSASLMRDYQRAGSRMLVVYLPYAAVILLALLARLIPSVDIRSITSTLIFGPFTLARPVVAGIGVACGVLAVPRFETVVLGAIVLIMMLGLETVLTFFRKRRRRASHDVA